MAGKRWQTTPLSGPRRKRPNRRLERSARTYSPNLVEGKFSEVCIRDVARQHPRKAPYVRLGRREQGELTTIYGRLDEYAARCTGALLFVHPGPRSRTRRGRPAPKGVGRRGHVGPVTSAP